jgi:hypothetical protein
VITSEISLTPYVRAVADLRWNLQLPEQDCLSDRARLALIWNDLLSSPRSSVDGGLANACRGQLAGIRAADHVASAVSRGAEGAARRARSPGCHGRHVVSRRLFGARTAKTTDVRGRFDDESR